MFTGAGEATWPGAHGRRATGDRPAQSPEMSPAKARRASERAVYPHRTAPHRAGRGIPFGWPLPDQGRSVAVSFPRLLIGPVSCVLPRSQSYCPAKSLCCLPPRQGDPRRPLCLGPRSALCSRRLLVRVLCVCRVNDGLFACSWFLDKAWLAVVVAPAVCSCVCLFCLVVLFDVCVPPC